MEIDTAKEFALCMSDIVDQFLEDELKDVQSFEEVGVLTSDAGENENHNNQEDNNEEGIL